MEYDWDMIALHRVIGEKIGALAEANALGSHITLSNETGNSFNVLLHVDLLNRNKWLRPFDKCIEDFRSGLRDLGLDMSESYELVFGDRRYFVKTTYENLQKLCEANGWTEQIKLRTIEVEKKGKRVPASQFVDRVRWLGFYFSIFLRPDCLGYLGEKLGAVCLYWLSVACCRVVDVGLGAEDCKIHPDGIVVRRHCLCCHWTEGWWNGFSREFLVRPDIAF